MSTCSSFTRSYQTLFVSVPQLKKTEVHPRLGETVACAPVSPTPVHTVMHTSAMLPATPVSPTPVHTVMHTSAVSHCYAHKCSVTRHTRFPPHLYTLPCTQVQCYPPFWQLHSDFGDFSSGVCHAMKNTIVDSHPNVRQQAFCFSPRVATGDSTKMPVSTMADSLGSGAAR